MKALKATMRRMLHKVGYDLRGLKHANIEERAIRTLLDATQPSIVLDVGANVGQFHDTLRIEGYRGLIISFEPLVNAHAHLLQKARKDENWRIAPRAAVGSKAENVDINVAQNAVSSSILQINKIHLTAAPKSNYIGKQKVPVERLDQLAEGLIPEIGSIYLKVDTQGYEKEVLEGSTGILGRVSGLQLELSIAALYDGSPTLADMISYTSSLGFQLYNLLPGFKDVSTGQVFQLEGFFIKQRLLDPNVS